jgi:hydroxymethylglutaryl-CoA lyase
MSRRIDIVEVSPRDGLQNEAACLPPEDRVELIRRLEAAGAMRIEAVSFVNERRVPQMAGAETVMAALPRDSSRRRSGLALNKRGWDRAVAAGCDEINVVITASDGFGVANQGSTREEQLAALAEMSGGPPLSLTIATAFGCPFEGEVDEAVVREIAEEAHARAVPELILADTIGVADPWSVRRRLAIAGKAAPNARLRAHFHDTRNTGLANAFAAVEEGVSVLDASVGGLGGCPFAPGATGNIGTEDLVYMLKRAGFETGYDLAALIDTARWVCGKLQKTPVSALSRAGGFPSPRQGAAIR